MNIFLAVLATLSAALQTSQAIIKGHVDIGPLSPVARVGEPPPQPTPEMYHRYQVRLYQAWISPEKDQNGNIVQVDRHAKDPLKAFDLDDKGNFEIKAQPGFYCVEAAPRVRRPMVPRRPPAEYVRLGAGQTIKVRLYVDTSMR